LREALLGTWRLISVQQSVDGKIVKRYGDNPKGYLVYTTDDHVLIQFADRERPHLFGLGKHGGPALLETTEAGTELGYVGLLWHV
jgi:hypothetical protein